MGGHGSGGLFPGTIGSLASVDSFSVSLGDSERSGAGQPISNPVVDSVRTGSARKTDPDHSFPDIVDNYAGYASSFTIVGGDGKERTLLQLEGSLNGTPGIFEWIVDPDESRGVTHRRFIRGGTITGKPNQRPKKD